MKLFLPAKNKKNKRTTKDWGQVHLTLYHFSFYFFFFFFRFIKTNFSIQLAYVLYMLSILWQDQLLFLEGMAFILKNWIICLIFWCLNITWVHQWSRYKNKKVKHKKKFKCFHLDRWMNSSKIQTLKSQVKDLNSPLKVRIINM